MSRKTILWSVLVLLLGAGLIAGFSTNAQEPAAPAAAAEAAKTETPSTEATTSAEPTAAEKKEEPAAAAPAFEPTLNSYALDNMMLFIAAVLVIFMQAGFALVETGLNASKNAVNIMFKNYMDFVIGALLFFAVGFGLMYPSTNPDDHIIKDVLAFGQFGIPAAATMPSVDAPHPLHPQVNFLFQVAFCATAATIVSGSVAGRIQFKAYLIYTAFITAIVYPVSGMWMWGYGWLFDLGFKDFAGSVVVHTVGGFAGLAGAIALGPRLGRFVNGKPVAMPGHNLPFVCLGVFILLIGWYGFNPGSQLIFTDAVSIETVMLVAVNTTLAACAGSLAAMAFSWIAYKKPDLTFALNGGLAGLVGITANCHCVSNNESLMIGAIAGVVVCLGIIALDKLQIDDPVGAFPVHGCCGMWGGIATGIFGDPATAGFSPDAPLTLTTQLIGTGAIAAWALGMSLGLFYALKALGMLRVHAEEEIAGLDISEHGMYAYPQQLVALDSYAGSGSFPSSPMVSSSSLAAKPSTEAV